MFAQKTGRAKLDDVTRILSTLQADLDAPKLSPTQQQQLLEQLKVYGRDPTNSDPIFTQNGLRTLGRYAFESSATLPSQEALRCIANALLLEPKARQILVDLGHGPHAAAKFKSESIDDEFLLGRILFLMTYGTTLDYAQLVQVNHLADNINAAVLRHAKRYSKSVQQPAQKHTQPMDLMALCETLKLIFNITHFYPALVAHFSPSTPHVFKILTRRPTPPKPLDAPVNTLVNALLNLVREEDSQTSAFPSFDPSCNADHLITVLDSAIQTYPPAEMDTTISPLLTLLRHMHELAPPPVKTAMRARLLPSDAEREQPLGQSDTLPSRLLSLSASASTPMDRESISAFLFELSDSDAATFVHNVGYGYASGFLLSQNIAMPDSAMQGRAVEDAAGARVPVNPITGQRLDREADEPLEEMTQEEKEREAERLFVLFERLRATGVVDVENPITRAYQEGRITEIDSDDE